MATQKPYFLQSLTLDNFMLHRLTTLDLSTHPIILLTGANGCGKTQVLDAFILALGGHPKRLRKGIIADAIGPFGKSARIEITLANPKTGGRRLLTVPDKKLAKFTDADRFSIVATIEKDSGLDYFIRTSDKQHKVMRRDVRALLDELNLRAENKLAFTEEGTVNVFSDNSDKNKLDLLLETTGLTVYRENIANTLDSIEKATRSLDPLRRKLSLEKEYLQSMKKTRDLVRQKEELMAKHRQLVIEEAWSHVATFEKEVQEIQATLEKKRRDHHILVGRSQKLEDEIVQYRDVCEKLKRQKRQLYSEMGEMENRCSSLKGENESNKRLTQKIETRKAELEEQRNRMEDARRIARRQEVEEGLKELEREKQKMLKIKESLGERFFSHEAAFERATLAQAVQFYDAAREKNIALHGPVFHEIRLKDNAPSQCWQALTQALGCHLFSFIATELPHFESALALAKDLWQETPAFFIVYLPHSQRKDFKSTPGFATGPSEILYFLEQTLKIHIVFDNDKACEVWRVAQEQKQSIWHDQWLYLPWPAAGRNWHPTILSRDNAPLTLEDARQGLKLEENYHNLLRREQEMQQEYEEFKTSEELHYVKEQIKECIQNLAELNAQISQNNREAEKLRREIEQIRQTHDEIAQEIERTEGNLQAKTEELRRLEGELETMEKAINAWQQNLEERMPKLEALETEAKAAGPRPQEVRCPEVVTQQRTHLEGKLETLEISSIVTEEEYQAQKDKVQDLETELMGSDEHLQNLKNDIAQRFNQWHTEVAQRIQAISSGMCQLLAGIVQGVRLRVDNLKDPAHAGLHIEVKRHSDRWHDLSQLSGGEKVLTIEALILSLHLQADSPIHAIDECTQRLDMKFKAQAFEMVQAAVMEIERTSKGPFASQFILLAPDTLGVEFSDDFHRYFKELVLGPARIRKKGEKHAVKIMM